MSVIVGLVTRRNLDNNDSKLHTYLWSCQTYAIGTTHCRHHGVAELAFRRPNDLDWGCSPMEARITYLQNT